MRGAIQRSGRVTDGGDIQPQPHLGCDHELAISIGKDSDAGRDWGQEEKGTTEDEMAVWHH